MKKTTLKSIILLIIICTMFLTISGCSGMEHKDSPYAKPTATADVNENEISSPSADCESYEYRIDYNLIPDAVYSRLTEAEIEAYGKIIAAFKDYETEVSIDSDESINHLTQLIDSCFPVFFADVKDDALTIIDKTITWDYTVSKEEHFNLLSEFEDIVLSKLNTVSETSMPKANSLTRMLSLYRDICTEMNYSYSSQDYFKDKIKYLPEDEYMNHTYDALSSEQGVCWCYARAYAFLLNHIGIEAFTTSCDGGIGHHEWTVFSYDGQWFFADPTWDMYGSLSYFGVTTAERESHGYAYDDMKFFCDCNFELKDSFAIDDIRFKELDTGEYGPLYEYTVDAANNRLVMHYFGSNGETITKYFDLETLEFEQ